MDKNTLRAIFLKKRISYNYDSLLKKSYIIQKKILKLFFYNNTLKNICIYLPIKNEVSTNLIIEYCFKNNIKVFIPRMNNNHTLVFTKIAKNYTNNLVLSKWNIFESNSKILLNEKPDIIIIPLVCYNSEKNRIGYGGGYYDRFACSKKNILKIGIAYSFQEYYDLINYDKEDIKMNFIITEL